MKYDDDFTYADDVAQAFIYGVRERRGAILMDIRKAVKTALDYELTEYRESVMCDHVLSNEEKFRLLSPVVEELRYRETIREEIW